MPRKENVFFIKRCWSSDGVAAPPRQRCRFFPLRQLHRQRQGAGEIALDQVARDAPAQIGTSPQGSLPFRNEKGRPE
jgi:hypothetical protein